MTEDEKQKDVADRKARLRAVAEDAAKSSERNGWIGIVVIVFDQGGVAGAASGSKLMDMPSRMAFARATSEAIRVCRSSVPGQRAQATES